MSQKRKEIFGVKMEQNSEDISISESKNISFMHESASPDHMEGGGDLNKEF